jgi:hypothetical protein
MKLPNFRLPETQATASLVLGIVGLLCLLPLAVFVFHGISFRDMVIPYNPESRMGHFRVPLVYVTTAGSSLACVAAGVLGFGSLGEKRNTKQTRSWLGMTIGALCLAMVLVIFFAWLKLSEPIVLKQAWLFSRTVGEALG